MPDEWDDEIRTTTSPPQPKTHSDGDGDQYETVVDRRHRRRRRRRIRRIRRFIMWLCGGYLVWWLHWESIQLYLCATVLWLIYTSLEGDKKPR
jgi:cell division septal protein FtsQ